MDYRAGQLRSLSMGDVIALDDDFYVWVSIGWHLLDIPPDIAATAHRPN